MYVCMYYKKSQPYIFIYLLNLFLLSPTKPVGSFNQDKNACLHTIKDHY